MIVSSILILTQGCNSDEPATSNQNTVQQASPAPPVNPKASALSNNSVKLNWIDNSDNEDGFKIYRDSRQIATVQANANVFNDAGLQPATEYQYSVRSYNQYGESSVISCSVMTPGAPPAPSYIRTGGSTATSITVSWTDNADDESGYRISRDGSLLSSLDADTCSFTDSGLQIGTAYTYSIVAFNQYGESTPACAELSTRNIPLQIYVDRIEVLDDKEPVLRGKGDIYLLFGIVDGDTSTQYKLPSGEGNTFNLGDGESLDIATTIYTTQEISDTYRLFVLGYESDGGTYEQLACEALDIALDIYTHGASSSLLEVFNTSLSDIVGDLLGEEDDYMGTYEITGSKLNNFAIGEHTITLQDEEGKDCLILTIRIGSN